MYSPAAHSYIFYNLIGNITYKTNYSYVESTDYIE